MVRMDPVNLPAKSKVIDFGANRKCVRDFLLVCQSNLGPILHHFRDIAVFCASE